MRTSFSLLLFSFFSVSVLAGCVERRSVLTTMPSLPSPASTSTGGDVRIGARVATEVEGQRAGGDTLLTPRAQLDGIGTIHIGEHFAVRPAFEIGFAQGALGGGASTFEGTPTLAAGPGLMVRIDADERRFLLDLEIDPMFGWVVERTELCTTDFSACGVTDESLVFMPMPRASARVSYELAPELLRGHVAIGMAAQPTSVEIEDLVLVGIVGAGLEIQPVEWLAITADIQWPFAGSPFTYWPTIGFGARFQIDRAARAERL